MWARENPTPTASSHVVFDCVEASGLSSTPPNTKCHNTVGPDVFAHNKHGHPHQEPTRGTCAPSPTEPLSGDREKLSLKRFFLTADNGSVLQRNHAMREACLCTQPKANAVWIGASLPCVPPLLPRHQFQCTTEGLLAHSSANKSASRVHSHSLSAESRCVQGMRLNPNFHPKDRWDSLFVQGHHVACEGCGALGGLGCI